MTTPPQNQEKSRLRHCSVDIAEKVGWLAALVFNRIEWSIANHEKHQHRAHCVDGEWGTFISVADLMEYLRESERQVIRALNHLRKAGLINSRRVWRSNFYTKGDKLSGDNGVSGDNLSGDNGVSGDKLSGDKTSHLTNCQVQGDKLSGDKNADPLILGAAAAISRPLESYESLNANLEWGGAQSLAPASHTNDAPPPSDEKVSFELPADLSATLPEPEKAPPSEFQEVAEHWMYEVNQNVPASRLSLLHYVNLLERAKKESRCTTYDLAGALSIALEEKDTFHGRKTTLRYKMFFINPDCVFLIAPGTKLTWFEEAIGKFRASLTQRNKRFLR